MGRKTALLAPLRAGCRIFHLYLLAEFDGSWRFLDSEPLAIRHSLLAAFRLPRDAVAYIMDTFPIVRRKDEEKYDGNYRPSASSLKSTTKWPKPCEPGFPTKPASTLRPARH
jgi:hypothetical protein